jgi:hypothetical protein
MDTNSNSHPFSFIFLAVWNGMTYIYMQMSGSCSCLILEGGMKKKILLGTFLLMGAVLLSIGKTPSAIGQANTAKACDERLITVLNPAISTKLAERIPLGLRLDTLEGKTIYLVDMQWGGPTPATAFTRRCRTGFCETCRRSKS